MRFIPLVLSVKLGFRKLTPLSEGQVRAILRRWARLRSGTSRGNTDLGMPHGGPTREPAWLLWCGTIDAKLGRLPRHRTPAFRGWECSGPELEARVNELLEDEQAEVEHLRWKALRCRGASLVEIRRREAELDRVREALGELRWSRAYGEAMEALRWELAEALEDSSFARADRMLQEREA